MNQVIGNDRKTNGSSEEASAFFIPFDPALVGRSIWRRKWIVFLFTLLSTTLGYLIAARLMQITYSTEAVLLRSEDITDPVALGAFEDMAHLPSTYMLYGKKLDTKFTPRTLAKLVSVSFEKKSGLVRVSSENTNPETAAKHVNVFVDTFSEVTRQFRRSTAIDQFNYYSARLKQTRKELNEVELQVRDFKKKHGVVDMTKQVKSLVEHYNHFDQIYEEKKARASELTIKLKRMKSIIEELNRKAQEEEAKKAATLRSRTTMRKQAGRLKEKIAREKEISELNIKLSVAIDDLAKYENLFAQGLVSGVQVQQKRDYLHSIENELNETPTIKKLQEEIERIDEGIIPKPDGEGANALILKEMVVQQIELRLEETTAEELVNFYDKTRASIKEELDRLPSLESEFNSLYRRMTKLSLYEVDLKKELDEARLRIDSEITAFHVIQKAPVPVYPNTTRKILVVIAFAIFGLTCGLFLTFAVSVLETKLTYGQEVSRQLGLKLLTDSSREHAHHTSESSQWLMANMIDQTGGLAGLYEQGKVIMVTSLEKGEGRTYGVETLYDGFVSAGLNVAVLPLDFRGASQTELKGVSEEDFSVYSPDQLESRVLTDLVEKLKRDFEVVLIEAPPCEPWVDAEMIAGYCDGAVLVLKSGTHRSMSIRWSLAGLESPILKKPLGVILTTAQK